MNERTRTFLKSSLGVLLCASTAALLCILFIDGPETRLVALAICLQGVIITSLFCGRMTGLIGSAAASLTFALWLLPPIGKLAIGNSGDRFTLLLFQLTAAVAALLSPAKPARMAIPKLRSSADQSLWQPQRILERNIVSERKDRRE